MLGANPDGCPGAPAFIYVAPRHVDAENPALAGWMGHHVPFAFDRKYAPAPGTARMRAGTHPVVAMAVLEKALHIWNQFDLADIRRESMRLTNLFISEVEMRCASLSLASLGNGVLRGSHVSFTHAEGYAIMPALIVRGVIGDFRAPNILRLGFCPLYNTEDEIHRAPLVIENEMKNEAWRQPLFMHRNVVT